MLLKKRSAANRFQVAGIEEIISGNDFTRMHPFLHGEADNSNEPSKMTMVRDLKL